MMLFLEEFYLVFYINLLDSINEFHHECFGMVFGRVIWDKVQLKNGPGKICGRQPLKNLKAVKFLKAVVHKFYLVHFLNTFDSFVLISFLDELYPAFSICAQIGFSCPSIPLVLTGFFVYFFLLPAPRTNLRL